VFCSVADRKEYAPLQEHPSFLYFSRQNVTNANQSFFVTKPNKKDKKKLSKKIESFSFSFNLRP